ncbi:sel1 repeat family protein [Leptolyngbya sp. FACHB-36]|nr:sel1 repeat family protein [Leptolyngbya sp. FACHB-36]
MLGTLYQLGLGVDHDLEVAVYWYRLASDQGECVASNNLASIYATEPERAKRYYNKARSQGFEHTPQA